MTPEQGERVQAILLDLDERRIDRHAALARVERVFDAEVERLTRECVRLTFDQPPFDGESVKMVRETFCVAQGAVGREKHDRWQEHVNRLQRLCDICDQHRPLGPDGRHGNLHTPTCGCEDKPEVKS